MTVAASPEPHLPTLPAILARRAADAGLDGRRSVTAAALARQAIESAVDEWLAANGAGGWSNRREAFLCLAALHPDPALARQAHDTWARLSSACHATSYELPPITSELERWIAVARRFVDAR